MLPFHLAFIQGLNSELSNGPVVGPEAATKSSAEPLTVCVGLLELARPRAC